MKNACAVILLALAFVAACSQNPAFDLDAVLTRRPSETGKVYDFTGLMGHVTETSNRYLNAIETRYGIEILIVALPGLEGSMTTSEAAAALHSNWGIGKNLGGRGLLILLVNDVKEVKIEVGFGLEDVFTDLFTSHAQMHHLRPHYNAGTLEVGLIAVLEACEARARTSRLDRYASEDIARLDSTFLSQGGGARHELGTPITAGRVTTAVNRDYPAGESPEDAWGTLLRAWKDGVRDPFLGVYTATARLAYRDYAAMPEATLKKNHAVYAPKPCRIRENGTHAVILFASSEGWDNAPFLFCKTQEGWQFDLVSQRRFIRMGPAPHWGVEFGDHPYMTLLSECPRYDGQDIPLADPDRYTADRDQAFADRIVEAEARYQNDPSAALDLGRIYALTAMGPKAMPLLTAASAMNPSDPRPFKYLAVAHVDAHYQYNSAQQAIDRYTALCPDDPFGWNFSGYIRYKNKDLSTAAEHFEKALSLADGDVYTHAYLSLVYARLRDDAMAFDPRRTTYGERSSRHAKQVRAMAAAHPIRAAALSD